MPRMKAVKTYLSIRKRKKYNILPTFLAASIALSSCSGGSSDATAPQAQPEPAAPNDPSDMQQEDPSLEVTWETRELSIDERDPVLFPNYMLSEDAGNPLCTRMYEVPLGVSLLTRTEADAYQAPDVGGTQEVYFRVIQGEPIQGSTADSHGCSYQGLRPYLNREIGNADLKITIADRNGSYGGTILPIVREGHELRLETPRYVRNLNNFLDPEDNSAPHTEDITVVFEQVGGPTVEFIQEGNDSITFQVPAVTVDTFGDSESARENMLRFRVSNSLDDRVTATLGIHVDHFDSISLENSELYIACLPGELIDPGGEDLRFNNRDDETMTFPPEVSNCARMLWHASLENDRKNVLIPTIRFLGRGGFGEHDGGHVWGFELSPDRKWAAAEISSEKYQPELFIINLENGEMRQLTNYPIWRQSTQPPGLLRFDWINPDQLRYQQQEIDDPSITGTYVYTISTEESELVEQTL